MGNPKEFSNNLNWLDIAGSRLSAFCYRVIRNRRLCWLNSMC